MNSPPRRRSISAPPAALPWRLPRARAAIARQVLWIATDFAAGEGGGPYGPGLDLFGLASARLLVLRVPQAGRCALGDGGGAALPRARLRRRRTDRRRRRRPISPRRAGSRSPRAKASARRTRPRPADPPSRHVDAERGGDPLADRRRAERARRLSAGSAARASTFRSRKNRRGPSGRWIIKWDHHEHAFQPAVSVGVAAPALDRPDRAPLVRAG